MDRIQLMKAIKIVDFKLSTTNMSASYRDIENAKDLFTCSFKLENEIRSTKIKLTGRSWGSSLKKAVKIITTGTSNVEFHNEERHELSRTIVILTDRIVKLIKSHSNQSYIIEKHKASYLKAQKQIMINKLKAVFTSNLFMDIISKNDLVKIYEQTQKELLVNAIHES